jgi:membrane-associated phospholipid phosphatase
MTRETWLSAAEWAVIAVMLAMDMAFAWGTGIPVIHWQKQAAALSIVIAGWPAIALVSRVTGLAKGATFVAEIPGKALSYILVASVLEYYLATSPLPLHDDFLNGIDRALGFDWVAMCNWAAPHTTLSAALTFAYFNLSNETCLVLLVIVLFYPRRARRFTTALILSSVVTIPFLWIFPVIGPFNALSGLPDYCISDAVVGTRQYMMMRTHGFDVIDIETLSGIVAFPSYHATAALLLTYLLRGIPIVFPAAVCFNALMIAATPLIGGHFLIDVLAGFATGAVTIYLLQRLEPRDAPERAPLWPAQAEASSAQGTAAP